MNLIAIEPIVIKIDPEASQTAAIAGFTTIQANPVKFGVRIGIDEGNFILALLHQQKTGGNSPVFLFIQLCEQLSLSTDEIVIDKFENNIYGCTIVCSGAGKKYALNCRISDATMISLHSGQKLHITEEVLQKTLDSINK